MLSSVYHHYHLLQSFFSSLCCPPWSLFSSTQDTTSAHTQKLVFSLPEEARVSACAHTHSASRLLDSFPSIIFANFSSMIIPSPTVLHKTANHLYAFKCTPWQHPLPISLYCFICYYYMGELLIIPVSVNSNAKFTSYVSRSRSKYWTGLSRYWR